MTVTPETIIGGCSSSALAFFPEFNLHLRLGMEIKNFSYKFTEQGKGMNFIMWLIQLARVKTPCRCEAYGHKLAWYPFHVREGSRLAFHQQGEHQVSMRVLRQSVAFWGFTLAAEWEAIHSVWLIMATKLKKTLTKTTHWCDITVTVTSTFLCLF